MAVWTLFKDTFVNDFEMSFQIMTDGTYIYWVNSTFDLVQYDPDTDTETIVYTKSTAPIYFMYDYTVFNGELYIAGSSLSPSGMHIFKYDGTPDNWTLVDTLNAPCTAGTWSLIWANDDHIVAMHIDYGPLGYTSVSRYSTDGASWSGASFETDPIAGLNSPYSYPLNRNIYGSRPIIAAVPTANEGVPPYNITETKLMRFSGGGWTDIIDPITDVDESCRLIDPTYNQCWTWTPDGGTSLYAEKTNDTFTTPTTPDANVQSISTSNWRQQFGIEDLGATAALRLWNGGWTALDTVGCDVNTTQSNEPQLVVLDNLDAYMVLYDLDTSQYEIWERGEKLPSGYGFTHSTGGIPGAILELPVA